jgi:hypothetical protein
VNHLRVFNDAIVTVGEFIDIQAAKDGIFTWQD